mmetsp:Transcript_17022/g.66334  ORF Transcript_17022/g.66334 Transcript_17022/m.66334 type:complete len:257 (-) Transcript_17022:29-799(-)
MFRMLSLSLSLTSPSSPSTLESSTTSGILSASLRSISRLPPILPDLLFLLLLLLGDGDASAGESQASPLSTMIDGGASASAPPQFAAAAPPLGEAREDFCSRRCCGEVGLCSPQSLSVNVMGAPRTEPRSWLPYDWWSRTLGVWRVTAFLPLATGATAAGALAGPGAGAAGGETARAGAGSCQCSIWSSKSDSSSTTSVTPSISRHSSTAFSSTIVLSFFSSSGLMYPMSPCTISCDHPLLCSFTTYFFSTPSSTT